MYKQLFNLFIIILFLFVSNCIYAYERTVVYKHNREFVYNACLDAFKEVEKENDGLFYFEKSKEYISVSLVTKQKSLVNINVFLSVKGELDSKVRVSVDQEEDEIKALVDDYVDLVNKALNAKNVKQKKKVKVKQIDDQEPKSISIDRPIKQIPKVSAPVLPLKVKDISSKDIQKAQEEKTVVVPSKTVEIKTTLDKKTKNIVIKPEKQLKDDFVALVKKSEVKSKPKELTPEEKFKIYKRTGYNFYLAKEYVNAYKNYKKALAYNNAADIQMWVIRCVLKGIPQAKKEGELNLLYSELDKYSSAIKTDELSPQYKKSYKYIKNDIRLVKKNKKNYYLNLKNR